MSAPTDGYAPDVAAAASLAREIVDICEEVSYRRARVQAIGKKCVQLVNALEESLHGSSSASCRQYADELHNLLERVHKHARKWRDRHRIVQWFLRSETNDEMNHLIQELETALDSLNVCGALSELLQTTNSESSYGSYILASHELVDGIRKQEEYDFSKTRDILLKIAGEQADLRQMIASLSQAGSTDISVQTLKEQDTSMSHDPCNMLNSILNDKLRYKALLGSRGNKAQIVLDILQKAADLENTSDEFRRATIYAIVRLCKETGAFPDCLALQDISINEGGPVASGGFGEVWKGTYQGSTVSMKTFKLGQQSRQESTVDQIKKDFAREAILWSYFEHPNLLPFYGVYYTLKDTRPFLVSSWMENGNIHDFLKSNTEAPRLPLVLGISAGLQYLHDHKFVHGDLKAANILISSAGSACLADFGLSSVVDLGILTWTTRKSAPLAGGTLRWEAPELLDLGEDDVPELTFACDIYSLASVMYEVLTDRIPYHEIRREATVLLKVITGTLPTKPSVDGDLELTEEIWEVMKSCWSKDPSRRPTIRDVVQTLDSVKPNSLAQRRRVAAQDSTKREQTGKSFKELTTRAIRATTRDQSAVGFSAYEMALLSEFHQTGQPATRDPPEGNISDIQNFVTDARKALKKIREAMLANPEGAIRSLFPPGAFNTPKNLDQEYRIMQRGVVKLLGLIPASIPSVKSLDGEVQQVGDMAVAGGFTSDIWKGLWLGEIEVALKTLRNVRADDESAQRHIAREIDIWSELSNDHILQFYGYVTDLGSHLYLVSPWLNNGSVLDYLKACPDANKMHLLRGAAEGLRYLHGQEIIHGNIKCSNIMVSDSGEACINDFGMARVIEEMTRSSLSTTLARTGSIRWLAPEIVNGESPSKASDAYSFGMAILELLTGKHPFVEYKSDVAVVRAVIENNIPKRPEGSDVHQCLSDDLWKLLVRCWAEEPKSRPTMGDIASTLNE